MSGERTAKKPRLEAAANAVLSGNIRSLRNILDDRPTCPEENSQEWLGAVGVDADQEGWNVLHLAAMTEQVACIEVLLEKCPYLATATTGRPYFLTPLVLAVKEEKDLNVIQALIKGNGKKAINAKIVGLFTTDALFEAFKAKRPDNYAYNVVKLLLANGANSTWNMMGAIYCGNLEMVKLVMRHGCKIDVSMSSDYEGKYPLHLAAQRGNLPILKFLMKQAPSLVNDARTREGVTTLMFAARSGHVDCVEALISAGANPNAQNDDGICVLTEAACRGKHEVVKMLLKQKSVRATAGKMSDWRSELHPLTNAVDSGSAETVRLLANSKFFRGNLHSNDEVEMECNMIDKFCIQWGALGLLSWAIHSQKNEAEEIFNVLIDAGYPVNISSGHGVVPPLTVAVMQLAYSDEMERITRRLLEEGADLNYTTCSFFKKNPDSASDAFVVAIQLNSEKALRMLLQYWDHAPAELLVTYDKHDDVTALKLDKWAPVLLEYGIPHGHPFVAELETKLQNAKIQMPSSKKNYKDNKDSDVTAEKPSINQEELFSDFLSELRTPSSLEKLARFAVRQKCGETAAAQKETLPTVLKTIKNIPGDVMSYLLMEKP